jgi:hypothetical protein
MRIVRRHKKIFFHNSNSKCFLGRWITRSFGETFIITNNDDKHPESGAFCPLSCMDNTLFVFKDYGIIGIGYCLGYIRQNTIFLLDPEQCEVEAEDPRLYQLLKDGLPIETAFEFICL